MQKMAQVLAIRSIKAGIIEVDDTEWFIYSVEKRLTTLLTSALFLAVGSCLANSCIAVSYLSTFLFLRTRTNGFHARTYYHCLLASIGSEVFFLRFLLPLLTPRAVWVLNIVSISIILVAAPVNSPNIHMTRDELKQTKKNICIRLLCLIYFLLLFRQMISVLQGITLGNTMAALFLVIAIIQGGMLNAQKLCKKNCENSCTCNNRS